MTRLSVNLNKVALIRNARGGNLPNLVQFALDCEKYGAQGITVHPRPDERHIRFADVPELKSVIQTELNVEGYPSERFLKLVEEVKPAQCSLVPDGPNVLTSSEGWNVVDNLEFLKKCIERINNVGTRVSLFMENDLDQISAAGKVGADRIELYTGPYAWDFSKNFKASVAPYIRSANHASSLGLGVNAGHDLNLENLTYFIQNVENVLEVSIGHALISDALYLGIEKSIRAYLDRLNA